MGFGAFLNAVRGKRVRNSPALILSKNPFVSSLKSEKSAKNWLRSANKLAKLGKESAKAWLKRAVSVSQLRYHPFQNHYTHEIIIFELFRGLQLQLSGVVRIN